MSFIYSHASYQKGASTNGDETPERLAKTMARLPLLLRSAILAFPYLFLLRV
jgi:hypothetical protein